MPMRGSGKQGEELSFSLMVACRDSQEVHYLPTPNPKKETREGVIRGQ
jgi:hypothetical protein